MVFLYYPIYLLVFYFKDLLGAILRFYVELNKYIISLFSISLLLKTFFKPLKNEYREGLVGFSRVAGIFVKSFLLIVSALILLVAIILEAVVFMVLILLPFSFLLFFKI